MPSKPPFYEQETPSSCVPACLRIVFGSFGVDIAEADLREQCDCTPYFGTDVLMAVDAARKLGFNGTAKHTLTLEQLRTVVTDGLHPIVFVNLSPIDGTDVESESDASYELIKARVGAQGCHFVDQS